MNGPTCVKCTPVLPSMWDILYIISDDSPMLQYSDSEILNSDYSRQVGQFALTRKQDDEFLFGYDKIMINFIKQYTFRTTHLV